VDDTFSDTYLSTISANLKQKIIAINGQDVNLMLWDLGHSTNHSTHPKLFFNGASAVVLVFDVTRIDTADYIFTELEFFKKEYPNIVIKVIGNKADLIDKKALQALKTNSKHPIDAFTSAKLGENVENVFREVAEVCHKIRRTKQA